MMVIRNLHLTIVMTCLFVSLGCGDEDSEGDGEAPRAAVENVRQLPEIVGTPTDAGYFDGGATLLGSADPNSGEALMPTSKTFPMALRLEIDEAATLLPHEYSVVIDKRRYRPKGISFGEKRETFFSLARFAADEIKLSLGGADQITTNKAGKLDSCELAAGEVYLLYRVPGSSVIELQYDGQDYEVRPSKAADLGVEPSATKMASSEDDKTSTGPRGLQLEVVRAQLAIGEIDGKDTELFELELKLTSSRYETIDLNLGKDFYLEGNAAPENGGSRKRRRGRRTRNVFLKLIEDRMQLLTGTEYFENTYKDEPMQELVNGGVTITVKPGQPVTAFFVFPKPPFENGLSLHFPGKPPLDVVSAGDVLGEIRPAIPRGVAKIPRAPIVGEPVKVNIVQGNVLVDGGGKSLTPQGPGGGKQFVMLKFTLKGERQFVPRDYALRDAADTSFYPVAVSFGDAAALKIPGDGYEGIKLVPGDDDVIRKRKGQLLYWQYSKPELLVIFAIPQTLSTFDFSHGNRLLKITPVTPPKPWKEFRPNSTLTASSSVPTKKKKPTGPPKSAAERNAERAASQLRLGKLLQKKDADKARAYFEKAMKLAPDSEVGQEAKQLLDKLK